MRISGDWIPNQSLQATPGSATLVVRHRRPGVEHNALGLLKGLGDANWDFYRTAFGVRSTAANAER
jgi:hypothetical protein